MANEILLLSDDEVKEILTIDETYNAVENVLVEKGLGRVQMPPKLYIIFKKYAGDFRTMPSYMEKNDIAGVKIVNVHPDNPKFYNRPAILATIILIDPRNGILLAIIGGTSITAMRTGAISGVATKYLGRRDSTVLALVGAGVQARTQLLAISKILDLNEVRVLDKTEKIRKDFIEEARRMYSMEFISCENVKDCVREADIISTITPVSKPIVMNNWISSGTHINAIGADAPGKEELDPQILKRAKIVVDDLSQASHSGEINVPLEKKIIGIEDIYGELSDIIIGKKNGRTSEDEVTIFDSTGLSLQGIAVASIVYEKAKNKNVGKWVSM